MAEPTEEIHLPLSTLSRLLTAELGSEFTCSEEAKHVINDCCKELIQLLASESNEMRLKDGKTRIMPIHLTRALQELDFSSWIPAVESVSEQVTIETKTLSQASKSKRKLVGGASGKSLAELKAQQDEKFRLAREKMDQQIRQIETERRKQQMALGAAAVSSLIESKLDEPEEPETKKQRTDAYNPSTINSSTLDAL